MNKKNWMEHLKFLKNGQIDEYVKKRDSMVSKLLKQTVNVSSYRNKLHTGPLSPGCVTCGEGTWSCMFINGLCTANCSFCPQFRGEQTERKEGSEFFTFKSPLEYNEYLKFYGFRGVGFSGGEPFIVFDKLTSYIRAIKQEFGDKVYTWAYTNGHLGDEEKFKVLKDIGLDEIRFNIIPMGYSLVMPTLAKKVNLKTTIEIPVLIEDKEKLKTILPQMVDIGIDHLNLHQLYATEHNYNKLSPSYNFIEIEPGNNANVESKLAALEVLQYTIDNKINLSINFCTHAYKSRLQSRGERIRLSIADCKPYENITETGLIRQLGITNDISCLRNYIDQFTADQINPSKWNLDEGKNMLYLHEDVLDWFNEREVNLQITYFEVTLKKNDGYVEYSSDKNCFQRTMLYQTPILENFKTIENSNVPKDMLNIIALNEYVDQEF